MLLSLSSTHHAFRQQGWLATIACWLTVLTPLLMIAGRVPADIGASLVAILFLAHVAIRRDLSAFRPAWVKLLLLCWLYMLLAALFTEDPGKAAGRAAAWIRYPIFAIALAYWVLASSHARQALIGTSIFTLCFLIADGFLQYITGTDLFGRELVQHEHIFRLTGPFSDPRLGITMVWLCLPAAAYLLARGQRFNGRMLFGIGIMSAMAALVYVSGERTANLFMLFAALALLILCPPVRLRIGIAVSIALVLITGLTLHDEQLITRQIKATGSEITGFFDSAYGKAWQSSVYVWQSAPLSGVGPKHFQRSCEGLAETQRYPDGSALFCPLHPHNVWLEWLVNHGMLGLALFAGVLGCWLAMAWRKRQHIMASALCCGLFVTLCIRFFPFASTASQFTAWSAVPLWLCVGWLIALLTHEDSHADHPIAR